MNDAFAAAVDDLKNRTTTDDLAAHAEDRTEAGDPCPDGDCDHTLFDLRHPKTGDSEIPPNKDAPELELVCIHHGIQAAR